MSKHLMDVESRQALYVHRMPIRWGDMDAMGHVNNTVYFRYMEQTRIEWLCAAGLRMKTAASTPEGDTQTGPVIINAQCTFLRQLRYPAVIDVRLFIGDIGRTSFDTLYEIVKVDESTESASTTLIAQGQSKIVWIDLKKEKAIPLPERVLRMLEVAL